MDFQCRQFHKKKKNTVKLTYIPSTNYNLSFVLLASRSIVHRKILNIYNILFCSFLNKILYFTMHKMYNLHSFILYEAIA